MLHWRNSWWTSCKHARFQLLGRIFTYSISSTIFTHPQSSSASKSFILLMNIGSAVVNVPTMCTYVEVLPWSVLTHQLMPPESIYLPAFLPVFWCPSALDRPLHRDTNREYLTIPAAHRPACARAGQASVLCPVPRDAEVSRTLKHDIPISFISSSPTYHCLIRPKFTSLKHPLKVRTQQSVVV